MKASIILIVLFSLVSFGKNSVLSGQQLNTWKGGMPGQETNWNCPKNWSNGHVPDEFQNVLIPDVTTGSGAFPVIEENVPAINTLVLESGSKLHIAKGGHLVVNLGLEGYGNNEVNCEGILQAPSFYAENLTLEGLAKN